MASGWNLYHWTKTKTMKKIQALLNSLLVASASTGRTVRLIALILAVGGAFTIGALAFSKTKIKPCEDCGYYKKQANELLEALIGIKKDIKEVAAQISYPMDESTIRFMYASYDTVPKKKQTQQQIKLGAIATKIDSIIKAQQQKQIPKQ